jgi:xylulokinase
VVTVGVDIGTTSVKAVAATDDGTVVARARVEHPVITPAPNVLEHDARLAWRDGVVAAAREVAAAAAAAGYAVAAVDVAAMVPSLCPVDAGGVPVGPGLLYGDERAAGGERGLDPSQDGELVRMLTWLSAAYPDAAGFWPAQAVANAALCGVGAIDSVTAMTTLPLFDFTGWDPAVCAAAGVRPEQLPVIRSGSDPAGTIGAVGAAELGDDLAGAVVGGGTIDAFGEQLVAGADADGDVLLIMGATLITWACVPEWVEAPGLWTVPHTAPGMTLVGGPSNAGGLLRDWAARVLAPPDGGPVDPDDVPVLLPYLRGERTPLHDRDRRASVHDVAVAHGPEALWRAVHEASGHSVRHHLDLAGLLGPDRAVAAEPGPHRARRIVATGGGSASGPWVQAIADVCGLPVDCVAEPRGGALGAAYLARVAAGLAPDASGASRWARTGRRVEPDPAWRAGCHARYRRFVELTGPPYDHRCGP